MRGDEPDDETQVVAEIAVSPTCVGMNRPFRAGIRDKRYVSPTCVGMNRVVELKKLANIRFPHMRGDEPTVTICAAG